MPQHDNEKRGVLFRNDRKESDSHPDYKGNAQIEGVEYWMDAWINEAQTGKKYMSVKFKPKGQSSGGGGSQVVTPQPTQPADDDIPF